MELGSFLCHSNGKLEGIITYITRNVGSRVFSVPRALYVLVRENAGWHAEFISCTFSFRAEEKRDTYKRTHILIYNYVPYHTEKKTIRPWDTHLIHDNKCSITIISPN